MRSLSPYCRPVSVLLLAVVAGGALAGTFEMTGKLTPAAAKYSFEFETTAELTRFWVEMPVRTKLAVTVEHDGQALKHYVASVPGPLDITDTGAFIVTIERESVDCQWRCRQLSAPELTLRKVAGFAGPDRPCRFAFSIADEAEDWEFIYPTEAVFHVRRIDRGRVVEEQDLADDTKLQLVGAGAHRLEVAAVEGAGEFTAGPVK